MSEFARSSNRSILVPDPIARQKLRSLRGTKSKIGALVNTNLSQRADQLRADYADVLPIAEDPLDACIMILAALGRISLFVETSQGTAFEISSRAFRDGAWGFLQVETVEDCIFALSLTRIARHSLEAPLIGQPILCSENKLIEELKIGKPSDAEILKAVELVMKRFDAEKLPKIKSLFLSEMKKLPRMSFVSNARLLDLSEVHRTGEWKRTGPRTKNDRRRLSAPTSTSFS